MRFSDINCRRLVLVVRQAVLIAFLVLCVSSISRGQQWKQYADSNKNGWSQKKLEAAREFASNAGSGAVLVIDRGSVVVAWGNIEYPYKAASIRKSIYDATIGATHHKKSFDVNVTVDDMGIDDIETLSDQEKSATFENLMAARSGVYHGAAYETPGNAALRPKRGSAAADTQWYYNNWDFNVVPFCFEKLAGVSMQSAFEQNLAKPLGFEDYRPSHFFSCLEPRVSKYPALTIRVSARDLARIGQLYLRQGTWNGNTIVDRDWIDRSTDAISVFGPNHPRGEGNGYGRLWWVFPKIESSAIAFDRYHRVLARGTGGQTMVLFPEIDVIIVHLANTDASRGVGGRQLRELLTMIVDARQSAPADDCALKDVEVALLKSAPESFSNARFETVSEEEIGALTGVYEVSPQISFKLYEFDNRLFAQPIGLPYPDVELFKLENGSFGNPITPVVFRAGKTKDSIAITFEGRTVVGKKK